MKLELTDRWEQTHCMTAKIRYATRRKAKLALKRIKQNPLRTEKQVYRCKRCKGFHLTSRYDPRGTALKDFDLEA